jgi:hypothetical protein
MSDSQNEAQGLMRVSPVLAAEIGLNESIVLMQLQFLNEISDVEIDGIKWSFNTLKELTDSYFPFLSRATLSRVLTNLASAGLLKIENFNRLKFDRTQWFHVDLENCAKLRGFIRFQNETRFSQNETSKSSKREIEVIKMRTPLSQNETTIQETQEEI